MVRSALAPLSAVFAAVRARLAGRPDTEHEQAIVRIAIGAAILIYLVPGALGEELGPTLFVMLAFLGFGAGIFAHILASPGVSTGRRALGVVVDMLTVTWLMAVGGEHAAPLFLVYVWVTLANGFRFGQRYLLLCLVLSVTGLGVGLFVNEFWRAHQAVGVWLTIGFIVLSLYVRSLVTKLFDALARAEAANQAKRRFISVVSHEMRTPLNAIIGMADLLRGTSLSREQADMLQTLRGSSRLMLGLVDDVLDFSKIEAGKVVLAKTDFDLHALVNSTCRILTVQAAAKNVDFVVMIMPEVPPMVRGDPHYLRQVLINLGGNAVKFTERGSVTVHVSAQVETDSRVQIKFSIRDTGIGIPPEAQGRIFESFTQADQSTTRRFGGTGLGTTIAKQLVGLMGGRIGLESAVGLGSTFWFELALDKQPERGATGTGELAGARILLIGFPREEHDALEQVLSGWGATAVGAEGVEQGISTLVSDISLAKPYRSVLIYAEGQEMRNLQQFRRALPDPAPPVVLGAKRQGALSRFDALSGGFAAVLELPFEKRYLFNVLHSVAADEEVGDGVVRLQDYARRGGAQRLRVLVADDNPTNREVIGKILERGGHNVTLVNDGEQALNALEVEEFDAAVFDRNMPGVGGIEALQALRLMTRGRARLPVILLSADATTEAKREALEAGADAFLSKPVEAMRLLHEVQSLVTAKPGDARAEQAPAPVTRTTPAEGARIIDEETLRQLEGLGSSAAFVERLVTIFLADNTALVERIEQALAARDYGECRAQLHALKGSSASMGTDRLTQACARFGALSDAEMRLQAPAMLRSLGEELAAARTELDSYLVNRRQSAG